MEIIMAIVTSFIASVGFYIFFQFIPEKKKYNRIRPRIEVELMEITDSLFFYLEIPFQYDIHFASQFQEEIKRGKIERKDFEIGLYNKCLNETYLFDENADKLIVIGKKLQTQANQISNKIKQVLMNQQYLTADEILIIEDIDRLLYTHLYKDNAFEKIGKLTVHPINPTISYMSENFNRLYILWLELRRLMYKYTQIKKETRQGTLRYFSLQWEHLTNLIDQKEYENADKLIKKLSKEQLSDFQHSVLEFCLLRIDVEKDRIEKAKVRLEKILRDEKRDKLVYQRSFLECIRGNNDLMQECISLCDEEEIKYWNKTIEQEHQTKESFIQQNTKLKEYYENKIKNQPPMFNT